MSVIDLSKPVIWTANGNKNFAEKYIAWSKHENCVKLRLIHKDADGNIIREDAYVLGIDGLATITETEPLA